MNSPGSGMQEACTKPWFFLTPASYFTQEETNEEKCMWDLRFTKELYMISSSSGLREACTNPYFLTLASSPEQNNVKRNAIEIWDSPKLCICFHHFRNYIAYKRIPRAALLFHVNWNPNYNDFLLRLNPACDVKFTGWIRPASQILRNRIYRTPF